MSEPPAKGDPPHEHAGDSTRAVHGGEREHQTTDAVTTPIYQTSTSPVSRLGRAPGIPGGRTVREEYGRYGNPTVRTAELKMAALEGTEDALGFGSGMAAPPRSSSPWPTGRGRTSSCSTTATGGPGSS